MEKYTWHVLPVVPNQEGAMQKIKIAGKVICLVRRNGKLSAMGNRCPHAGADLSQGWCEDNKIVCPYHRHRFNLTNGKGDAGQANFIPIYPIKEEEGKVFIGIKQGWWKALF